MTSKKSNSGETRPKPTSKKSTEQERQDIAPYLRQHMNAEGSLPQLSILIESAI
jgi:hypothetical protein